MGELSTWGVAAILAVLLIAGLVPTLRSMRRSRELPTRSAVDAMIAELAGRYGLARQGVGDVAAEEMWDMLGRAIGRHRGYDVQVVALARLNAFAVHAEDYTEGVTLVAAGGDGTPPRTAAAALRDDASRAGTDGRLLLLALEGDRGAPCTDTERVAAALERTCSVLDGLGVGPVSEPPVPPAFVPVPSVPPKG